MLNPNLHLLIQSKSGYFVHLISLPKRQNNPIDKNPKTNKSDYFLIELQIKTIFTLTCRQKIQWDKKTRCQNNPISTVCLYLFIYGGNQESKQIP